MQQAGPKSQTFPIATFWGVGLLFAALLIGGGWVVDILLLACAGLVFAVLLLLMCELIAKLVPLSHGWRLLISSLLLLGMAAGTFQILAPRIADQAAQLQDDLPKAIIALKERLQSRSWGRWIIDHMNRPLEFIGERRDLFGQMTGVVSGALGALGAMTVIVFAGLYFAAQPSLYIEGVLRLVPPHRRSRGRQISRQMADQLRHWLIGQLIAVAFIGAMTWIGLWLLGIHLALTLALIAAILAFIPNFGPIIAAVPAVLIALLQGPATAAWVAGLYITIQTIESYLITPLIQQRAVALPPALTLFSQLIMGSLVGGVGLALATPLTVLVLVAVRCLYVEDVLEHSLPADSDSDG